MNFVYVIDDSEVMSSALSGTLGRLGYTTEVYNDPNVFLATSTPVSPAVILMDMRMPGMSGVQLQERLLKMGRTTPIIFISGEAMGSEIVTSMKQGAVDFLFKPFNLEDLLQTIQRGLALDLENTVNAIQKSSARERYETLTPREKEVAALLAQGQLSKTAAINLGISTATIKVHKAKVLAKMKVQSLQELALCLKEVNLT